MSFSKPYPERPGSGRSGPSWVLVPPAKETTRELETHRMQFCTASATAVETWLWRGKKEAVRAAISLE
jgi:hypothetical protein